MSADIVAEAGAVEEAPEKEYNDGGPPARWYIVHAYSNFERRVAETIREQAERQNLQDCFVQIEVPTEEVVEVHRNQKRIREQRHFPGYVLVKMRMTDDAYHLVKNVPKVTGFLGAQNKPQAVSEKEVKRILGQAQEAAAQRPRPVISYEIGERVRVVDGPFQSFEGLVSEVDEGRGRLKVAVMIFNRETLVDLEYSQVEKMR
ncbi:MAG: transcription termination/antitermination protein NusG [Hyphomonadaceae bacterium]|nr:transcription termination/antitermination protein NusG [Hyphomonadaceae bacterium]